MSEEQLERTTDVRRAFHFEETLFVFRVQRSGRIDQNARASGERKSDIARHVEPMDWFIRFPHKARAKPDNVIFPAIFPGEPFEIEPLVALVRHDHAAERGIAADERRQEPFIPEVLPEPVSPEKKKCRFALSRVHRNPANESTTCQRSATILPAGSRTNRR